MFSSTSCILYDIFLNHPRIIRTQMELSPTVTQMIEQQLSCTITTASLLSEGASNINYVLQTTIGTYILRLSREDAYAKAKKRNEIEALTLLQKESFCPKIAYPKKSASFVVVSFAEGSPITFDDVTLQHIAVVLKKLHSYTFKKWGHMLPPQHDTFSIKKYIQTRFHHQLTKLPEQIQKNIADMSDTSIRDVFCLVHGDVNAKNILCTKNNGIVLIDWEGAEICVPERDIADLFVIDKFTPRQKQVFLEHYGTVDHNLLGVFEKVVMLAETLDDFCAGKNVTVHLATIVEDVKRTVQDM